MKRRIIFDIAILKTNIRVMVLNAFYHFNWNCLVQQLMEVFCMHFTHNEVKHFVKLTDVLNTLLYFYTFYSFPSHKVCCFAAETFCFYLFQFHRNLVPTFKKLGKTGVFTIPLKLLPLGQRWKEEEEPNSLSNFVNHAMVWIKIQCKKSLS